MRTRAGVLAVLLVAVLAALAVCGAGAAVAKKKRKGTRVFDATSTTNAPIPARSDPNGPWGVLSTTIEVPKSFKGLQIRDVNVTLQTTGTSGNFPAAATRPQLTAPNGATVRLFSGLQSVSGAHNIGPLTLDDESPLELVSLTPSDPVGLYDPWIGSARPEGDRKLAVMDNGPARGTWTLTVLTTLANETSTLNFWRLTVAAGRPYRTR
jgi:hypothetical protein